MKNRMNLLPQNAPRSRPGLAVFIWTLLGAIVIGGLVWMTQNEMARSAQSSGSIRSLEQKLLPIEHLEKEILRMKTKLVSLESKPDVDLSFVRQNPILTLLGTISESSSGCKVCVGNMTLKQQIVSESEPPIRILTLHGIGVDNIAVAKFTGNLSRSRCFEDVNLKSTSEQQTPAGTARHYEIECQY